MALRDQLQNTLGSAYTIERELDGAGMSRIFLAHEATLDRRVVVKTLSTDAAGSVSAERFRREIRLAASLQQANIVPVLSAGEMEGIPYYTMPFVDGESLRHRLANQGALSVREAVSILRDIARALVFAHERGVVHRDIKPENVLLSGSTAVVTDFGIAKAIEASRTDSGAPTITQWGTTLGTPAYMSPEQASGDPHVDHRADIYALGIVAYELLTGATPFAGRPLQAILAAHVLEQPRHVGEVRLEIGRELGRMVMACLAKDPGSRPQSSREVLESLEQSGVFNDGEFADPSRGATTRHSRPTIAVLPFANMNASADDEYFSDGMTEDIIAQLSQIASLRVISRTSAMRFKNSSKGTREIAAALGATHVVEGSVRRAGSKLRIVAQLIAAATDDHLWARTFDRELTDVFAIQSEVAEQVANALRSRLSSDERQRFGKRPTSDLEAYNLFLLARHHFNAATADGFNRAIELYERATQRDPSFARAYAAQSLAYHWHIAGYFGIPPRVAAAKATALASRAIELDPDVAEAYAMLGSVEVQLGASLELARAHQERSLALNPNLPHAHLCYGNYLMAAGRPQEAIEAAKRALEVDPAAEIVHIHANWIRYNCRELESALAAVEIAQNQLFGPQSLSLVHGEILLGLGRAAEAVQLMRELSQRIPVSFNQVHLAWFLAAVGEHREAISILGDLHAREATEYVWPMGIAVAYAHLGEMDRGFQYLTKSYEDGAAWIFLPDSPTFDPFRNDRRFDALARQILKRPWDAAARVLFSPAV